MGIPVKEILKFIPYVIEIIKSLLPKKKKKE